MKYTSLPNLRVSLVFAATVFYLQLSASAACAPPSGQLVICQPSANSAVYQVPHIEANTNPISGSITTTKVYIDNKLVFTNGGPEISLFEGGVSNGTHHLIINSWDDLGRLYQAQVNFSVTGNLPFSCPTSAAGVRICAPAQGEVVSENLGFSIGFKGNAPISHVRAYLDGSDVFDHTPAPGETQLVIGGVNAPAGTHTLKLVAWDTTGKAYTSSVGIKTYYDGDCAPKGNICTPGIYPSTPNSGDDVESPFRLSASVQFNTASITAMKVYVDGVQTAASSGPVFDQPISAAKGTHIVVVQAWDTAGKLYRLTENVNVQ